MIYTWDKISNACSLLHTKVVADGFVPKYIIGLTRGGLIPATILSHKFACPLYPLNLSLRDNVRKEIKDWMVTDALACENILIVDDINDTGATFTTLTKEWESLEKSEWDKIWHHNVRFAVIDNNLPSAFKVDYCNNVINKSIDNTWIVYPWEN
jgi:hypoxanthine phosphoribosyltransferase